MKRLSKFALQNICEYFPVPTQVILLRRFSRTWDSAVFESLARQVASQKQQLDALYLELDQINLPEKKAITQPLIDEIDEKRQKLKEEFLKTDFEAGMFFYKFQQKLKTVFDQYYRLLMKNQVSAIVSREKIEADFEQSRGNTLQLLVDDCVVWLQAADYFSMFDVNLRQRRLPGQRMTQLAGPRPSERSALEQELLKSIDIEKMVTLFEAFFTQHRSFDYALPLKRLITTRDGFHLRSIQMSMKGSDCIKNLQKTFIVTKTEKKQVKEKTPVKPNQTTKNKSEEKQNSAAKQASSEYGLELVVGKEMAREANEMNDFLTQMHYFSCADRDLHEQIPSQRLRVEIEAIQYQFKRISALVDIHQPKCFKRVKKL